MLNPFAEINWKPDLRERRKFALSLIIGFPSIALVFFLMGGLVKHNWHPKPFILYLAAIGGGIGVVLWLIPQIAKPFYLVWYFIAGCMGFVMGNVIFSAMDGKPMMRL